jgi:hypothetical protein
MIQDLNWVDGKTHDNLMQRVKGINKIVGMANIVKNVENMTLDKLYQEYVFTSISYFRYLVLTFTKQILCGKWTRS